MHSLPERAPSDRLWPGWDAKVPEIVEHRKPLYRRRWVRRLAATLAGVLVLAGAVSLALLRR